MQRKGYTVSNIVITVDGARGTGLTGGSLHKSHNI